MVTEGHMTKEEFDRKFIPARFTNYVNVPAAVVLEMSRQLTEARACNLDVKRIVLRSTAPMMDDGMLNPVWRDAVESCGAYDAKGPVNGD